MIAQPAPEGQSIREQGHQIVADHERRQRLAVLLAEAHGDKWGAITVQLRRIYYGIAQRAEPGIRELYCEREMVAPGVGELRTIPELQPISSRAVLPDPRLWTGTGYDSDPRD